MSRLTPVVFVQTNDVARVERSTDTTDTIALLPLFCTYPDEELFVLQS